MTLPDKPFVLGQTEWYRLVSVPTSEGGRPTFKVESKTTNLMGETVWIQSDVTHGIYTVVVSAILHHLHRLAYPAPADPNS